MSIFSKERYLSKNMQLIRSYRFGVGGSGAVSSRYSETVNYAVRKSFWYVLLIVLQIVAFLCLLGFESGLITQKIIAWVSLIVFVGGFAAEFILRQYLVARMSQDDINVINNRIDARVSKYESTAYQNVTPKLILKLVLIFGCFILFTIIYSHFSPN